MPSPEKPIKVLMHGDKPIVVSDETAQETINSNTDRNLYQRFTNKLSGKRIALAKPDLIEAKS